MKLTKEQLQIINDALITCEEHAHDDVRRARKAGLDSFVQTYKATELRIAETRYAIRSIAKDLGIELEPYGRFKIKP